MATFTVRCHHGHLHSPSVMSVRAVFQPYVTPSGVHDIELHTLWYAIMRSPVYSKWCSSYQASKSRGLLTDVTHISTQPQTLMGTQVHQCEDQTARCSLLLPWSSFVQHFEALISTHFQLLGHARPWHACVLNICRMGRQ